MPAATVPYLCRAEGVGEWVELHAWDSADAARRFAAQIGSEGTVMVDVRLAINKAPSGCLRYSVTSVLVRQYQADLVDTFGD